MGFDALLGNQDLKRRLSGTLHQGKAGHCFLIAGPSGSGKRTLARLLAAALECEGRDQPCGCCGPCRKVMADIHPDVITVDTPERKTVPVEQIRALQADAYIRPNEGRRKVYCFPRAQALTESAQNALLKLIEEPPFYGVFLLLSDNPEKLLPTVRSRCAMLRLEPVPRAEALEWLERRFPDKSSGARLAAYDRSGGYLGQAAELLERETAEPETAQLLELLVRRDSLALVSLAASLERKSRDEFLSLLTAWKELFALALMARAGAAAPEDAVRMAGALAGTALMQCVRAMNTCLDAANANVGQGHLCGFLAAVLGEVMAG